MNKIYEAICKLPDNPDDKVYWVCYNEDMGNSAKELISLIKGEEYLANVKIVTRANLDTNNARYIYYSPDLYDHVGNGAN